MTPRREARQETEPQELRDWLKNPTDDMCFGTCCWVIDVPAEIRKILAETWDEGRYGSELDYNPWRKA